MGAMTNRNPCRGKWVLVLVAVVVLTGCQTQTEEIEELKKTNGSTELGDAKDRKAEQLRQAADQGDAEAQYKLGVRYVEGDGVPQDHREAVKWYRLAAERGYAAAQFTLGKMYAEAGRGLSGWKPEGVPAQDLPEALRWLRLAADQGNAEAQHFLGVMSDIGLGVPLDHREAVKWYRMAAEQGHASAQHSLGGSYAEGEGVPQDYREAVKWYRKAAEQGHAWGQHSLGNSYAKGEGVPQDHVKAHAWLNLAAAHKFRQGQLGGTIMSFGEIRDRLAAQMTTAQIAEAQKLAADLWQRIGSSESE